jgi:hypothetical protein
LARVVLQARQQVALKTMGLLVLIQFLPRLLPLGVEVELVEAVHKMVLQVVLVVVVLVTSQEQV